MENIHYIPVQTKAFQNVKVHLKSSTEEFIPFEHGRAAITLHLKPLKLFRLVIMVYNSQRGRGFNDIFGTLNRTFKPVIEGAADVGANLATGLVGELLSGKSPKASIKATGDRAKTMVAQRALQGLQGGSGTKLKRKKRKQSRGTYFSSPGSLSRRELSWLRYDRKRDFSKNEKGNGKRL